MKIKDSQLGQTSRGKVRVYVSPKPGKEGRLSWITTISAIATLTGAATLIAGGFWLGVMLIINPNAVVWINRFLPDGTRIPIAVREPPQTLAQIQAEIRKKGLIPGEPQFLKSDTADPNMLLPVLVSQPACQIRCEQIQELRVYQLTGVEDSYRLASQVAVTGPDESLLIPPINKAESDAKLKSRSLPLIELNRLDSKEKTPGIWFNLSGELTQGDTDTRIAYGQVVHYNPSTTHLSVMLSWNSVAGQAPYWQEVTGGAMPELVVNQTVGLEPLFRVYQIQSRQFLPDPIYLDEISLKEPALDSDDYDKALILAQSGLWSPAWKWLQSLRKKELPKIAQAQMDLIRLHSQVTQSQSQRSWASPSQQVVANLINGSWEDALEVFKSSDDPNRYEIGTSLKAESGRLWKRIEAAIKVDPSLEVKAWGSLIRAAQQGQLQAIAWLQQQPQNTPKTIAQIEELLEQMDIAIAESETTGGHFSQIIGSAKPLTQVNPADWLQLDANDPPQLEAQQVWYQVQVKAFNDGSSWQQAPFSSLKQPLLKSAKRLWRLLGLNTDPKIQLTIWKPDGSQQNAIATVKAVQLKAGVLQLLAAGEGFSNDSPLHLLAHTQAGLHLLEPSSTTLADLNQQKPAWVSKILPKLWRELQAVGQLKQGKVPTVSEMMQQIGYWSVQSIDLTGNNKPEAVLTIYQDVSPKKPLTKSNQVLKPRTLIFSDNGVVVYNEFTTDAKESFKAIADLGSGQPTALVVDNASNYSLKRWSQKRQRFDVN